MAIIEIKTNDGELIDSILVEKISEPLDNARVWAFLQTPLGQLVVRRVEMAFAHEMGHPTGSRTALVEEGETPVLRTERDREPLMDGVNEIERMKMTDAEERSLLRLGAFSSDERRLIRNGLKSNISFLETVGKGTPRVAEGIEKNRSLLAEVEAMDDLVARAPLYEPPEGEDRTHAR
jgi:hypothetical protein